MANRIFPEGARFDRYLLRRECFGRDRRTPPVTQHAVDTAQEITRLVSAKDFDAVRAIMQALDGSPAVGTIAALDDYSAIIAMRLRLGLNPDSD